MRAGYGHYWKQYNKTWHRGGDSALNQAWQWASKGEAQYQAAQSAAAEAAATALQYQYYAEARARAAASGLALSLQAQYYAWAREQDSNQPTIPTDPTQNPRTSEQGCGYCALEPLFGTFALLEGASLTGIGIFATVAVITAGAPLWAVAIPAAIFVGITLVGINWLIVGIEEIRAGLHPDEHTEVDYLPLVHFFFPNALSHP